MAEIKFCGNPRVRQITLDKEQATTIFKNGLFQVLQSEGVEKEDMVFADEYNEVIDWLSDNKHKGLLILGDCGRGKTLIANRILKPIFEWMFPNPIGNDRDYVQTLSARELKDIVADEWKLQWYIPPVTIIDDVGTESASMIYGERHNSFFEYLDHAERKGLLLVITSNLTLKEISERYGERTIDRLKKLCRLVVFKGKSLRK